jgi:hypothetical protein
MASWELGKVAVDDLHKRLGVMLVESILTLHRLDVPGELRRDTVAGARYQEKLNPDPLVKLFFWNENLAFKGFDLGAGV